MEALNYAFITCGVLLLIATGSMLVRLLVGAALEHGYKTKAIVFARDWSDSLLTLSSSVGVISTIICFVLDILWG